MTEYTRSVDPCSCSCPPPLLRVESAVLQAVSQIAVEGEDVTDIDPRNLVAGAEFPDWGMEQTVLASGPQPEPTPAAEGLTEAYVSFTRETTGAVYHCTYAQRVKLRLTYVSRGLTCRLRWRRVTITETLSGGTVEPHIFDLGAENSEDSTGDDGEVAVAAEVELPVPEGVPAGGVIATIRRLLTGVPRAIAAEFEAIGVDEELAKAGFHAFQEQWPAKPVIYLTETASSGEKQQFKIEPSQWTSHVQEIQQFSGEINPAYGSPKFPGFVVPERVVLSPTQRHVRRDGEELTLTLGTPYTTARLRQDLEAALKDRDRGLGTPRAAKVLSADETRYHFARCTWHVVIPFYLTFSGSFFSEDSIPLTVRWKKRVRNAATGAKTVTEGSEEVTLPVIVDGSTRRWEATVGTSHTLTATEGTTVEITDLMIDPAEAMVAELALKYPDEPAEE